MTDLLPGGLQPDNDDEDDLRRHAFAGLAVLVGLAALVVVLLIVIISVVRGGHHGRELANTLAPPPSTQTAGSTTLTTSPPRQSTSQTTPHTTAPIGNPCPSTAACVVRGDAGGVIAALNRFRLSHGLPAVLGSASSRAQLCALDQGAGPACVSHFAWEVVPNQDGAQVISLIAGRGAQWLLDPGTTSVNVGWAYLPSTRQYECAILKVG